MRQLAEEGLPVTLALSLHAPDDELRDDLVPVNTRWKVDEVVDAADSVRDMLPGPPAASACPSLAALERLVRWW